MEKEGEALLLRRYYGAIWALLRLYSGAMKALLSRYWGFIKARISSILVSEGSYECRGGGKKKEIWGVWSYVLYMCPHAAYMCPHAAIYVSSCCYICVLMLLCMCPHAPMYVSSCCCVCFFFFWLLTGVGRWGRILEDAELMAHVSSRGAQLCFLYAREGILSAYRQYAPYITEDTYCCPQ